MYPSKATCDGAPFVTANNEFYASPEFAQKQNESAEFLSQLPPFLDGRPVTLENMYNIYDFINVQSIHNADFAKALPSTFWRRYYTLASWHEYNIFTSPQLDGIGNTLYQIEDGMEVSDPYFQLLDVMILPVIRFELQEIANTSNPLKLAYQSLAYKPFFSLFNMTAFEVLREPAGGGEPMIRRNFKNGTGSDFVTYNFLIGIGRHAVSRLLIDHVNPALINSVHGPLAAAANASAAAALGSYPSPPAGQPAIGAGFPGAGLTHFVVLAMYRVLMFMGLLDHWERSLKKDAPPRWFSFPLL
ncbi:hypothetical protein MSAN_01826400 [Mycena sanguinolenta]|uniref:Uncharacterized protein n=1 Tax=Mycena sanguinolenta TaxID=230812 RepID=A0A8H6XQ95_9AGAR|nr:hypothetical protein MSAN_01826400 [Mycena sanguinolenta]